MNNFAKIVEEIKKLDYEELRHLHFLTGKYLQEAKRDELLHSHKEAIREYKEGKLEFSSDFDKMMDSLSQKDA